jgi:hypothetical protein
MARMLDLAKSCVEGGLENGSRVVGAQLEPGTSTRLLVIGCVVGELDAEMSSAGKADNEHGLIDARKLHGPYRAGQDRLKALRQCAAPVRAREDMRVVAKCDHDVTPLYALSELSAERCSQSYILLQHLINTSCHVANRADLQAIAGL